MNHSDTIVPGMPSDRIAPVTLGYESPDDLWPFTLLNAAASFAAHADLAVARMGTPQASGPHYLTVLFLLAQSIELALKAFLRAKGSSESDLERIKHNLPKALNEAVAAGFPARDPADVQLLDLLDTTYAKQKALQYHRASEMTLPVLRPTRELADMYIAHTYKSMLGEDNFQRTLSQGGESAYGLSIYSEADYGSVSLEEFRTAAKGLRLRNIGKTRI
jgi:hypothetical protein